MTSEIKVDTISENTSANGVAVDGVTLKDGGIAATGDISLDGGNFVFNESSADKDFRVESDNSTHAFFVEGSDGGIGIGVSSIEANAQVHIEGAEEYVVIKHAAQMGIKLYGDDTNVLFSYDKSANAITGGFDINHATGDLNIYTKASGGSFSSKAKLHSAGVLSVPAGIELGSGLDATASNVLDDYEEGTFTPDFDDSSNNSPTSMTAAQGFYTKVGRLVTVQIYVEVNSKGSGMNGNVMRISNLPFTPVSNLQNQSMAVSYISNLDVNNLPVGAAVYSNNSFIYLYYISGDNSAQITPGMIADGTRLAVGGSYMST